MSMKFIELTNKDTGKRIAIDVFSVLDVVEYEDCTEIYYNNVVTGNCKYLSLVYVTVTELYDEVMFQLQRSCD